MRIVVGLSNVPILIDWVAVFMDVINQIAVESK